MKYIRTKDGYIYVVDIENEIEYISSELKLHIYKSAVIKIADTIEELCDRVVVKDFNNKEPRIYNVKKHNWRKITNTLFNIRKVEWVKFAIWTDKGLIYVAKMNDKGELELL